MSCWVNTTESTFAFMIIKLDEEHSVYFYKDGAVIVHEFDLYMDDTIEKDMNTLASEQDGWEGFE